MKYETELENLQSQVATLTEKNEKTESSSHQKEEQMEDMKKQLEALQDQVWNWNWKMLLACIDSIYLSS